MRSQILNISHDTHAAMFMIYNNIILIIELIILPDNNGNNKINHLTNKTIYSHSQQPIND